MSRLDSQYFSLSFGSERALTFARPALEELFAEWVARGHVPIVALAQPFETIDGTLIPDLSGDEDPEQQHFEAHHKGGPCKVHLSRELDGALSFELQILVTDRVRESELEPILQHVTELLKKAYG